MSDLSIIIIAIESKIIYNLVENEWSNSSNKRKNKKGLKKSVCDTDSDGKREPNIESNDTS